MILEIVGELDDTLEEEEQLSKAKEKLAKRLLKKKALKFQKLAATGKSKPEDGARVDVDRGVSVRKRMMMSLPPKSVLGMLLISYICYYVDLYPGRVFLLCPPPLSGVSF